ncbi:MAG TPA: acyl-CoA dehydrogenase family protein [Thermoplasmata archaeon]|nr:acyl-CoA dehydrogenase family protein [Thermoplasmata archaeon]
MDFSLSDEERAFQEAVRRFGDKVLRPNERRIDAEGRIPSEVLQEMARLGLLAMPVPTEYGGIGASAVLTEIAAEEIGRGDFSMATAVFFLLEAGWGYILSRHGTEEAKHEVLPPVCEGRAFLGIATTEPTGGSDLANMRTRSRRDGAEFVVRGEKAFVSGVEEAKSLGGGHLTLTRASDRDGFHFLYVPTRSPGISTQKFENMGRMGISTGGLTYDDTRVPEKYLIGTEGKGFQAAMEGFSVARTFVSAACIGAAERALETGMAYIRERQVFGQPLGKFEGIQFELVDLWTQVEAVKWQCRRAAWLLDQYTLKGDSSHRSEVDRAVASVKLTAPPIAFEAVKRVMMWFGAAGYTKDVGLELGFRGVMSYMVGAEGGLNIMRIILGRELLGSEFVPYK